MSKRIGIVTIASITLISIGALGWGRGDQKNNENVTHAVAELGSNGGDTDVEGKVSFSKVSNGVKVVADFEGLPPGRHTLRIFQDVDCDNVEYISSQTSGVGTQIDRQDDFNTDPNDREGTLDRDGEQGGTGTGTGVKDDTYDRDTNRSSGTSGSGTTGGTYGTNRSGMSSPSYNTLGRVMTITADADGKAHVEWTDSNLRLNGANSIIGQAIVIVQGDVANMQRGRSGQTGSGSGSMDNTGTNRSGTSTGSGTGTGGTSGGMGSTSGDTGTYNYDTNRATTGSGTMGGTSTTGRSGSTTMGDTNRMMGQTLACGMIEGEEE